MDCSPHAGWRFGGQVAADHDHERGLAFAAHKNVELAERELNALAALAGSPEAKKLDSPAFPVSATLAVPALWLAGKVAGAKGNTREMIEKLEKAVAAQDAIPYMEPYFWPIPARLPLGAALLQSGDAVKAEQVFREDVKRWPRNGWGLFGLEQSLRAQGKTQQADDVRRQFTEAWQRADVKLDLSWY